MAMLHPKVVKKDTLQHVKSINVNRQFPEYLLSSKRRYI